MSIIKARWGSSAALNLQKYIQTNYTHPCIMFKSCSRNYFVLGTCQKLAGGKGVETEGGSQLFETTEKGEVMKNGPLKGGGSCKYVSVTM